MNWRILHIDGFEFAMLWERITSFHERRVLLELLNPRTGCIITGL